MKKTNEEKLNEEIQKRINDPSWDKNLAKIVAREMNTTPIVNKYFISTSVAALILVALSIFALYTQEQDSSFVDMYIDLTSDMVVYEEFIDSF